MDGTTGTERVETVIVGGGQAGLTAGYHLQRRGRPFVILDGSERVGDAWRHRWDSLRLFTPAKYDALPGYRFPAPAASFPTKDEMADYLEAYARWFSLPVRTGVRVDRLQRDGEGFVLTAGARRYEADHVIVATGAHRLPRIPAFAGELDADVVQLHSSAYRGPAQLRPGHVLLVGAGNSGAEIAYELATTHRCFLAGDIPGQIPVRHGSGAARVAFPVVRFLGHHVLTRRTPLNRKLGLKVLAHGAPLIRRRTKDLDAAGVERGPRVAGVRDGMPILDDGRVMRPDNVVWCTGFRYDWSWIDLPVFGPDDEPRHRRGIVESTPGLYFLGLLFQFSESSDVLPSRGRDASFIVKHLDSRARGDRRTPVAGPTEVPRERMPA
jgi:putative flavoprotein involved in K+ transport